MQAPLLASGQGGVPVTTWALLAAFILSGLATVVAMLRTGINVFWASPGGSVPRVGLIEIAPVALLLLFCGALTIGAGPAMDYMQATAQALHAPADYIRGVFPEPDEGTGR
jgi:multicomponent K+:H+ antiporter subunit D